MPLERLWFPVVISVADRYVLQKAKRRIADPSTPAESDSYGSVSAKAAG